MKLERLTKLIETYGKEEAAKRLRVSIKTLDRARFADGHQRISLRRIAAAERQE